MQIIDILNADLLITVVISVFGGLIHGYTGFAGGMIIVPLIAVIFGPVEAITIMAIAGSAAVSQFVPNALRTADLKETAPTILGIVIGVPLGTLIFVQIDQDIAKRIIGGCVVALALVMLVGWSYKGHRSPITSLVAGGFSGWLMGVAGVAGPVIVAYFLALQVPPNIQRACIILSVATLSYARLISQLMISGIPQSTLMRGIIVIPFLFVSMWAGGKLFKLLPIRNYRQIALSILILIGTVAVVLSF